MKIGPYTEAALHLYHRDSLVLYVATSMRDSDAIALGLGEHDLGVYRMSPTKKARGLARAIVRWEKGTIPRTTTRYTHVKLYYVHHW